MHPKDKKQTDEIMNSDYSYMDSCLDEDHLLNDDYKNNSNVSCNTTPKKMSEFDATENENRFFREKSSVEKNFKHKISQLKKIELEFAKEMDSARSTRNSSETRNKYENYNLNSNNKVSLLELEILTETININLKSNDKNIITEEIFKMMEKIKNIQLTLETKKIFPVEYYKKWFFEYNKIYNEIFNRNKDKSAIIYDLFIKLNNESYKLMRSIVYYYLILTEIYSKEKKNLKKQYNNNLILKKDNIRLSHLMKSMDSKESYKKKKIKLTENKIVSIEIKEEFKSNKKIEALVGPDERIDLDFLNNNDILKDLNMNKNETLTNIDSINEISLLRTGRYQDAQNYREGILKITQEYSGLYDRTRNEYIERLLERQKNHDMEVKLMITSHKEDIDKMNEYFMEEKRKINEEHDRQLNEILQENKRKIEMLKSDHSLELRLVQQKYKQIINDNNKEKDNSIQAFKIKFEHILIDMENNKDRELLNMKIEYEDKINELKEYYKNIIDNLELELQKKELLYQDEKKLIIDEFVSAHKREIELLRNQGIGQISQIECVNNEEIISLKSDTNSNNEGSKSKIIEFADEEKYNEIIKRLDKITSRSSIKQNISASRKNSENKIVNEKRFDTTITTASSSTIPSNNILNLKDI